MSEKMLQRFGPYLQRVRKRKGWSLRELALRTGIPHNTLHKLERKGSDPRLSELALISRALSKRVTVLLGPLCSNGSKRKARKP